MVTTALAAAVSAGCGGDDVDVATADASADARSIVVDATEELAVCGDGHGPVAQELGPGDAGGLWSITYGIDPTCCGPQLLQVMAFGTADAPYAGGACDFEVEVPCGHPGESDSGACAAWCEALAPVNLVGTDFSQCGYSTDAPEGGAVVGCVGYSPCIAGRPPRAFAARRVRGPGRGAELLAWMAQGEAASIVGFEALRRDLARLGAPARLLRAVAASSRDEARHARLIGREAALRGARVPPVVVPPVPPRSIGRLAADNAREGCVRETFSAALAVVQAVRAADPGLRALLRGIARDEVRHAVLSWSVAAWLEQRMSVRGRARTRATSRTALAELDAELRQGPMADAETGTPDGPAQRGMLAAMRSAVEGARPMRTLITC